MFTSPVLSPTFKRALLSTLTATAMLTAASISNAGLFNKNLPTDKDAVLSVGVNAMAVNSAYDLEDSYELKVLPGVF